MASVDWIKLNSSQDVKSKLRHGDKDCRLIDEHENEHINKALTPYNVQTCDYATACKRFDDRIEYLDSLPKQNHRPGRILALGLEIPIPDEIPNEKVREFTVKANEIIKKTTGMRTENVIASYLHVDEVHEYTDSSTKQKRMSMRHIHTYIIPELDNKLNAKIVCSKKNMIAVNNAIEKMCQQDYGVAFLTGEKTKSKDSVESLKLKSKALELEERENVVEQREEAVAHDERDVEARERTVAKREDEADIVYRSAYKKLSEADTKLSEVTQREQAVAKREQSVRQAENSMTVKLAALQRRADELEERENELKERERNFKREVRKEAESLLERQKNATATLKQFENAQKQMDMVSESFSSSVFGSNNT